MGPARQLYGLGVASDAPIAALASLALAHRRDVSCHIGSMPPGYAGIPPVRWQDHRYVEESSVRAARLADRSLFRLVYDDGSVFVIDAPGATVWAHAPAGATLEDTAAYLLGPVMGFVLRLRGVTCLHASAVVIGGGAVAFAGHAGSGKSTLAAAFARAGCAVLTDDVTALAEEAGAYQVQPAYPRVRLWSESVISLFGAADALPLITPNWEKRFLALDGGAHRFQDRHLPLAAVYVIHDREQEEAIEPLEPAAALMSLVERGYSANLLDRGMRAREFELLHRLVRDVPVFRTSPPRGIDRLAAFCSAIARRHEHVPV